MEFDIAIIGAGPGGYVAALRAARLGAKVALIEKDHIGGTCLNWGCIPTKALAASAHVLSLARRGPEFGVEPETAPLHINFAKAQARKNEVVGQLRQGVIQLLKSSGIETIKGQAAFAGPAKIEVDGQPFDTKKIMVATGSRWWTPPNIELDGRHIVTSSEALNWESVPESLLIIGGGVIGCEFASIYLAFGSKITIVEAMPSILPTMEKGLTRPLTKILKERGMEILTGTTVQSAEVKGDQVTARLSNGEERTVSCILVAVGRRPCTANLNIEKSKIKLTQRMAIGVNEKFKTNVADVYAIGDVVGGPMLAHVASAQAVSCVKQMLGEGEPLDYRAVPAPIFTVPEMAGVGHTSQELDGLKIPYKTGRFAYAASGKAHCDGETEGLGLVHVDEKETIVGAHFLGEDATLLVAEAALALKHRLTARQVGATIHAHPTLSEVFAEAALDAVGCAIHKPVRKL